MDYYCLDNKIQSQNYRINVLLSYESNKKRLYVIFQFHFNTHIASKKLFYDQIIPVIKQLLIIQN